MLERHHDTTQRRRCRPASWLRRLRSGEPGERGAVLAEAAIILPVVLTLILGVMEFGFIWKDDLAIANGVHAAARIGAASGSDQYADYNILQQIKSGTSGLPSNAIIGVIVWEANTITTVPPSCTALIGSDSSPNPSSGIANSGTGVYCNYDRGSDVTGLAKTAFLNSCFSGPDHWWCPQSRVTTFNSTTTPDFVGVYIRINHNYVTRILGTSRTLTDQAIMRIEPS